jgi:acetylornithine deacetylase
MSAVAVGVKDAEAVKESVLAAVDDNEVLAIEQGCVRIPSPTFEEQRVAEFFAQQMRFIGLEVEMIDIKDPFGDGVQPVGRLRGTGGGKSLMINGHMDHVPVAGEWRRDPYSGFFDGKYVYGRGCEDDKGGVVSAIGAVSALQRAGVRLKGDVVIVPAMGHKSGAIGTRNLLKRGLRTDYAINVENSGNGIATVTVGALKARIHVEAKQPAPTTDPGHQLMNRQSARGQRPLNRFDQLSRFILALGPSLRRIPEGGWLTYTPSDELPDFPQVNIDVIKSEPLERRATFELTIRSVPTITSASLRDDLQRIADRLTKEDPRFSIELEVPPRDGQFAAWDWEPMRIDRGDPLVLALIAAHKRVTGEQPVVGAKPRLGAVGDASVLCAAGIKTAQYGPGAVSKQPLGQWPTPDEKVLLSDLVTAAKVYALTAIDICGLA